MKQKMYWKNGFYDIPVDGAVEITIENYRIPFFIGNNELPG